MPIAPDPVTSSNNRKLRIAQLAPLVLELACTAAPGRPCPVARRAVDAVSDSLVGYVRDLAFSPGNAGAVVLSGGLGTEPTFARIFQARLGVDGFDMPVLFAKSPAESGAVMMAKGPGFAP